jgi:two-component system, NtrC family, nitrogen regulation response regulator NtrX
MKKILLVDDNVMMRRLIINLFRNENLEIDEASDGQEGLDKISTKIYDLVITDIVMPGMEGIEMIIEAKKHHPNLKIIAISGSKPYYLYVAKKLGVEAVFSKPLNQHHFYDKVNNVLQFQPVRIFQAS